MNPMRTATGRSSRALALALVPPLLVACGADLPSTAPSVGPVSTITLSTLPGGTLSSIGDTAMIVARTEDARGTLHPDAQVTWSLSTPDVVELIGPGRVRALRNGRVTIRATVDPARTGVAPSGYRATQVVDSLVLEVRQQPARVVGRLDSLFLTIGARRPITLDILDARGTPLAPEVRPPLVLGAGNSAVVTVDGTGIVRSMGDGTTIVSVSAGPATWHQRVVVQSRRPHVSCMSYLQRRRTQQACVTNQFTLRETRSTAP